MYNNLQMVRKYRNFTQEQLAKEANVSSVVIGRIERNERSDDYSYIPKYTIRSKLAKTLDVPINVLFPDKNNA